jgi:hypothetical protein
MSDTRFSGDHVIRTVVAREAGNAFLEAAEGPFRNFCAKYLEPTGNTTAPKFKENLPALKMIGELSPIIACMSFSVELLTKVAIAQETSTLYKTHDVNKLWSKLSKPRKIRMKLLYLTKCEQWEAMNFPVNRISIGGRAVAGQNGASARDVNSAFKELGVAFVEWRYVFEALPLVGDIEKVSSFDFKAAFACTQALGQEIATMPGGFTSSVTVT